MWSFGQLSFDDQHQYIEKMYEVSRLESHLKGFGGPRDLVVNLITASHQFISSELQDNNPVSLRDATRCLNLYQWFTKIMHLQGCPFQYGAFPQEILSLLLALAISYRFKLPSKEQVGKRNMLTFQAVKYAECLASHSANMFSSNQFMDCINSCMNQLYQCFAGNKLNLKMQFHLFLWMPVLTRSTHSNAMKELKMSQALKLFERIYLWSLYAC